MNILLVLFAILGLAGAVVTFVLNANTPIQLGPIPFFGSVAIFIISILWLVGRHLE